MTYMFIHVLSVAFKQVASKSGVECFITRTMFSPEHGIMSANKHLTFQFVLLELATHPVYAPLHSTRQPRPQGEYTWRVCFSSQLCFQRPEISCPLSMMQNETQVEFTFSTHIMFPYTRYKVICTRQYTLV